MATYDDYDGVYFTCQALRIYQQVNFEYEIIILDNNPTSPSGKATEQFAKNKLRKNAKYISYPVKPTTFNKYETLNYVSGEHTLILDSHVLLEPNSLQRLVNYMDSQEHDKRNLLQGPLWYDDLKHVSTHFDPIWRGHMYGIWATNQSAYDKGEPFEIPMQGMGMCAFTTKHFPIINKNFRGFGGEEGYIAEKFRLNGGKNICIPWLRWNHRFERPLGVKYPLTLEDKVFNYYLGWGEVYGKDSLRIDEITNHFTKEVKSWNLNKFNSIKKKAFDLL